MKKFTILMAFVALASFAMAQLYKHLVTLLVKT